MATITIDTSLLASEAAWFAYYDGIQAFLKLRNAPLMQKSESVGDALLRTSTSFTRATNSTIEFSDPADAADFYGCLHRAAAQYSPALARAIHVE